MQPLERRPYQQRVVGKTVAMFTGKYVNKQGDTESPTSSVLVESPTGSGKTVMGLLIAKQMQRQYGNLDVCWVAMRRNLLSQVVRENERIGVENLYPTSMFDKHPEVLKHRDGRRLLTVVDECQHDVTTSATDLHERMRPDWILGLTATPFRTDSMRLIFSKRVVDAGIHQLVQDGYLSQYDHYIIDEWTPKHVTDVYLANPDRWGKSVFFFINLDQCRKAANILRSNGIATELVEGGNMDHRERQLADFREGKVRCLVNCMVLTEGFDEPSMQTVWVRDSSKPPTIQMAGRVFRKHPDLEVKQVVQSARTKWPMVRTVTPRRAFRYDDGTFVAYQATEELVTISNKMLHVIATADVKLPSYISDNIGKRRVIRFRRSSD